jgi:hypothetical protein
MLTTHVFRKDLKRLLLQHKLYKFFFRIEENVTAIVRPANGIIANVANIQ